MVVATKLLTLLATGLLLTGCSTGEGPGSGTGHSAGELASVPVTSVAASVAGPAAPAAVSLPPVAGRFSYQIGGAYPPPTGVSVLDRDRQAAPDPKIFSICYLNAYQAQQEAVSWWQQQHPELLLRDRNGALIIDTQWHEPLLDISTPSLRRAALTVVGGWLDSCAARGYRAAEADNLDSYTRSHGRLTLTDALAFAELMTARAHHDHLSIGQKNTAEQSVAGRRAGFDFAIAEECQVYDECGDYTAAYGNHLIEIEYTDQPHSAFIDACRQRSASASVVLRDRDVTPAGDSAHVEAWC